MNVQAGFPMNDFDARNKEANSVRDRSLAVKPPSGDSESGMLTNDGDVTLIISYSSLPNLEKSNAYISAQSKKKSDNAAMSSIHMTTIDVAPEDFKRTIAELEATPGVNHVSVNQELHALQDIDSPSGGLRTRDRRLQPTETENEFEIFIDCDHSTGHNSQHTHSDCDFNFRAREMGVWRHVAMTSGLCEQDKKESVFFQGTSIDGVSVGTSCGDALAIDYVDVNIIGLDGNATKLWSNEVNGGGAYCLSTDSGDYSSVSSIAPCRRQIYFLETGTICPGLNTNILGAYIPC